MHKKDRWNNAWTRVEDAKLFEAIEIAGSRHRKCHAILKELGVNRSYHGMTNRIAYLTKLQEVQKVEYNLPKGWGIY